MDEDVPWLYSIVLMFLIFLWVVGAVAFGLAHLNVQVAAHRGNVIAARGGPVSAGSAFGAAYYGVDTAPSWSPDAALRWGGSALRVEVPYASMVFGRSMSASGGAFSGLEAFYPGPPAAYE